MKVTTKKWLKLVKEEIDLIKKYATDSQKHKLSYVNFNAISPQRCIYGQMTGDCRSEDAIKLIHQCCKGVINVKDYSSASKNIFLKTKANGLYIFKKNNLINDSLLNYHSYLSNLEGYILMPYAKNKDILSYIKGNTKKLEL